MRHFMIVFLSILLIKKSLCIKDFSYDWKSDKNLDVSGNINLETLNVRNSGLTKLDLTENTIINLLDITNGGHKYKNEFNAASLNKLYRSLPERNGESEGVVRVIYSKDNSISNDGQGSQMSIAKSKNWVVTDRQNNKID